MILQKLKPGIRIEIHNISPKYEPLSKLTIFLLYRKAIYPVNDRHNHDFRHVHVGYAAVADEESLRRLYEEVADNENRRLALFIPIRRVL